MQVFREYNFNFSNINIGDFIEITSIPQNETFHVEVLCIFNEVIYGTVQSILVTYHNFEYLDDILILKKNIKKVIKKNNYLFDLSIIDNNHINALKNSIKNNKIYI